MESLESSVRLSGDTTAIGESVLGLAIHGAPFAELIGLTVTAFNNISQLELTTSSKAAVTNRAESVTSILRHGNTASEILAGLIHRALPGRNH